jgi:hypothetical protein
MQYGHQKTQTLMLISNPFKSNSNPSGLGGSILSKKSKSLYPNVYVLVFASTNYALQYILVQSYLLRDNSSLCLMYNMRRYKDNFLVSLLKDFLAWSLPIILIYILLETKTYFLLIHLGRENSIYCLIRT